MAMRNVDNAASLRLSLLQRFAKTGTTRQEAGGVEGRRGGKPAGAGDQLALSEAARRMDSLEQALAAGRRALADVPDVRADRIEAARARLQAGEYKSDAVKRDVAARLGAVIKRLDSLTD